MMNYSETVEWMYSRLPMFQRQGKMAYKADLYNITKINERLGNPHQRLRTVHVAGTNGKGSVSNYLAAVLQTAGYRTGLFTSPHLKDYRERIRVNGQMIEQEFVVNFVERYQAFFEDLQPSFFEMTTALAFDYFAHCQVDIAIVEVGLGGRLDSTNVISPMLSVITNISLDHTDILGDTLPKIAHEKAGIIKPQVPVVVGEWQETVCQVFVDKAMQENAPLCFASQHYQLLNRRVQDCLQYFEVQKDNRVIFPTLATGLTGVYQQKNIATVLQSVDILRNNGLIIPDNAIIEAVRDVCQITGLQGRWHFLGQTSGFARMFADTGHNQDGIRNVLEQINSMVYNRLYFVFGMVKDKAVDAVLALLPTSAVYYFTQANLSRALDYNELADMAQVYGLVGERYATVAEALEGAKRNAGDNDLIVVGGSTFVVAEVL